MLTGGVAADEASKYNSSTRALRLACGFSSELQRWKLERPKTAPKRQAFLLLAMIFLAGKALVDSLGEENQSTRKADLRFVSSLHSYSLMSSEGPDGAISNNDLAGNLLQRSMSNKREAAEVRKDARFC